MSTQLVDLWPDDLSTDVVSPAAIVRFQASQLERRTSGILRAEVEEKSELDEISLHLLVVAPALNGLRSQILTVQFAKNAVYPAYVSGPGLPGDGVSAPGQNELHQAIGTILRSDEVRTTLNSMIALSNEVTSDDSD